jgi:glucose repression mediator protein
MATFGAVSVSSLRARHLPITSLTKVGHCYLMMDDLQQAYSAYQQALYHLSDPKEPKLWYGIGILYDRYGSLEHAEEAFSQVMRMEPTFEKANEIYFRLGIIYKQQQKFNQSLDVSTLHSSYERF